MRNLHVNPLKLYRKYKDPAPIDAQQFPDFTGHEIETQRALEIPKIEVFPFLEM